MIRIIKRIIRLFKSLFIKNVYFVGSLDKLPEPLTKEEEVMYVKDGSKEAKNKLIEHNLRLVVI